MSMAAGDRFDVSAAGAVSVYSPLWATHVAGTGIALTSAGEVHATAGTALRLSSACMLDASAEAQVSLYSGNSILLNAANGPFSVYTLHEAFHQVQGGLSFYGDKSIGFGTICLLYTSPSPRD